MMSEARKCVLKLSSSIKRVTARDWEFQWKFDKQMQARVYDKWALINSSIIINYSSHSRLWLVNFLLSKTRCTYLKTRSKRKKRTFLSRIRVCSLLNEILHTYAFFVNRSSYRSLISYALNLYVYNIKSKWWNYRKSCTRLFIAT